MLPAANDVRYAWAFNRALDYASDYQIERAWKDESYRAPSRVTQKIFAVLDVWDQSSCRPYTDF